MFQAMQQARDHINLEYFIFEDVAVGRVAPVGPADRQAEPRRDGQHHLRFLWLARHAGRPVRYLASRRRQGRRIQSDQPARDADGPFAEPSGSSQDHGGRWPGRLRRAASTSRAPTRTRHRPDFPPTATRSMPIGATPRWKSRVPRSPNCSGCSSTPGNSRTAIRFRRPTTFRRFRARACRPSGSSAADQAISGRSIISRSSGRSARRTGASGCPPAISCRRTRSARIWQRRRDAASI